MGIEDEEDMQIEHVAEFMEMITKKEEEEENKSLQEDSKTTLSSEVLSESHWSDNTKVCPTFEKG